MYFILVSLQNLPCIGM